MLASGTPRSKSRRLTGPNAKSAKMWPGPHFGAAVPLNSKTHKTHKSRRQAAPALDNGHSGQRCSCRGSLKLDAQRGLSVSGHRSTVLCLHLTSDNYHVTPSGRALRARGKFWIRRVKRRIFRPDPKSHKSAGSSAPQISKTHKRQNTGCRSAYFSKAPKFVGAQNPRGTTHGAASLEEGRSSCLQWVSESVQPQSA